MTLMAEKTCCVCVCVEALAFILEPYLIQQAFNKGSIIEYQLIIWQQRGETERWMGQSALWMKYESFTDILRKEASLTSIALGVSHASPLLPIGFLNLRGKGEFSEQSLREGSSELLLELLQDPSCCTTFHWFWSWNQVIYFS